MKQNDQIAEALLSRLENQGRLALLTNEALVKECLKSDAADCDVVREMMNRLHPKWWDDDENADLSREARFSNSLR